LFLFIFSTFSFSPFFSIFFFFPFNFYPCIFIIKLFFVQFFSSPSENHKKRRLKTKHLEDERKHHQRPFISFFLDVDLVGQRTTGMEVAILQHGGGVAEDEVDGALSYSCAQ